MTPLAVVITLCIFGAAAAGAGLHAFWIHNAKHGLALIGSSAFLIGAAYVLAYA